MESRRPLSVSEITEHVSLLFDRDALLGRAAVRGEILDFKRHSSGHAYFALGDGEFRLACVLFRGDAARVSAWPEAGDEVIAEGRISVYGARGTYQLYAHRILPVGRGAKFRARAELERALEREGLFDSRLKRPLPSFPETVAIVTSPTGAAVRDVLKVGRNRFPICCFVVVPTLVQGIDAGASIVDALRRASGVPGVEAVLLVRGGGGKDDLLPFDEECVVRAVRNCPVPVVTGVGHEIDRSLADLAADAAAPTPSAAALLLLPDATEILARIHLLSRRCEREAARSLTFADQTLSRILSSSLATLLRAIERGEASCGEFRTRATFASLRRLEEMEALVASKEEMVRTLSPMRALERGFVLCEDEEGHAVISAEHLSVGKRIVLRLVDGTARATVTDVAI